MEDLLDAADNRFFETMQSGDHCRHSIMSSPKKIGLNHLGAVPYTLVLPESCQQCLACSGQIGEFVRIAIEKNVDFDFGLKNKTT